MSENLTILAVSNRPPSDPNLVYDEWLTSCRRYSIEPVITGDKPGEYLGLGSRPKLLKRAIEKGLVKTDYLLFMDAWDIVFADDPRQVLKFFLGTDRTFTEEENHGWYEKPRIIWNAEKNCFPDAWRGDEHPISATPYRYLNSGFAIGETSAFLEALTKMHADEICDDHTNIDGRKIEPCCQSHWMREYVLQTVPMALDVNCVACQTLHLVEPDELDFSEPRIRNKLTGSYPISFHFNGSSRNPEKGLREPILSKLNLI